MPYVRFTEDGIPGWFGEAPVFVNPGESVQLCTRHAGTVGTTGSDLPA